MKEKTMIEELYCEGILGAEKVFIKEETYGEYAKKKECLERNLRETFSAEQKDLFEKFLEMNVLTGCIEETATYRSGVAFGIKITAEAFLLQK